MIKIEHTAKGIECHLEGTVLDMTADITLALVNIICSAAKNRNDKSETKKILQMLISSIYKTACENLEVEP